MQELLVDAQNGKKEILLVENGKLMERYVDEQGKERLEGNIYLGVVENVLPGMQAAFVNICLLYTSMCWGLWNSASVYCEWRGLWACDGEEVG